MTNGIKFVSASNQVVSKFPDAIMCQSGRLSPTIGVSHTGGQYLSKIYAHICL